MRKKIIFFDGCGTLWYPKRTKYNKNPFWIYCNPKTVKDPNNHLILTPFALWVLRRLKKKGIILVLLSTSPKSPKQANMQLKKRVKHFKLENFFDEIHATRNYHGSKGEFISDILKLKKIPKKAALMVGDRYVWDYRPAINRGVDALLIESNYEDKVPIIRKRNRSIRKLKDMMDFL